MWYNGINSYSNCVPKLCTTIRKRGQNKDKNVKKEPEKQENVHGKMKHNKQENTLRSKNNQISSQSQKLESINGLY